GTTTPAEGTPDEGPRPHDGRGLAVLRRCLPSTPYLTDAEVSRRYRSSAAICGYPASYPSSSVRPSVGELTSGCVEKPCQAAARDPVVAASRIFRSAARRVLIIPSRPSSTGATGCGCTPSPSTRQRTSITASAGSSGTIRCAGGASAPAGALPT